MTWRRLTATLWFVAALTAGDGLCPANAPALLSSFHAGPDSDSLTLSAEAGPLPKYSVRRTGAQEITVTFQPAPGEKAPATPVVGGSKLVSGVRAIPGGLKIQLRTSGFGYVNFPVSGKPQLQIQIFADPVGSRWDGAKARPEARPEAKSETKSGEAAKAAADKKAAQEKAAAEKAAAEKAAAEQRRQAEAKARQAKAPEQARPEPLKPGPASQAQAPAQAQPPQQPAQISPAKSDPATGQPYFSVPYSMRAPVSKLVVGLPPGGSATLPPIAGQPAAEHGKPAAAPERVVGGRLPAGVVEKPLLQDRQAEPPASASEMPPPAPPPAQPVPAPPVLVDVQPPVGKADVRFRADRRAPGDGRLAEIISGAAPAPKAQAAAPAAIAPPQGQGGRPWELRQQVQKNVPQPPAASATLPPVAQADEHAPPPAAAPQQALASAAANASDHAPGKEAPKAEQGKEPPKDAHAPPAKEAAKAEHGKEGGKEAPGPLTEQQVKDKLLSAQSLMSAGQWPQAVSAFQELMREPNLKDDLREEALYSLADTYMQAYKDSLAANYDKIAGAQQAAMNANQKSRRVPRALLNLGLLNLKVGNLNEAKAYFSIIRKKYKLDQNAAMVPFALGEYYRAKGDLPKAAEQYSQLIQDHPDSKLVKETAYILAQTLRRLGNFDKAFQIIEYIDKRWPLFYMDAQDFLRLAAEVEEKIGKLAQAKDHYWTYYNLNPASEFADVTLVRIGDIYLRQNKLPAAKEVYQKAVRDFPDREGGLVARMRIAEEGAFDDPTMSEMVSVFGKPESLKPHETYELIISKYPQSPLAPLAQIKLGMWQFYSKAYLEAFNTASSFLEKYPKSPLVGKAKELGFQSFLQALPLLVQEGNFQRVMQLFDTAGVVKEFQDKISDEARMAIAVSAWKRGDPNRALKLASKFLGRTQVPKYSELALDLAMNIFMERKEWSRISDLAHKASAAWKLTPRQLTQFEHARAMALENQGEYEKSQPLWTRIASDPNTDLPTRAFATYTLAKAAARKQDMHRLFALSQDALSLLLQSGGDRDKVKDCLLMSITATERSGRYAETLKWAKEFDRIIPDSDPDWAPVRLRLADIYRQGGQLDEWNALLKDIVKKKPGTVYARMASQALDSSALDQRLQKYMTNKSGR
ncbi:MAG: tetratricopeptide repeat protein [Proteobacteria bacterium]|nr:tetratricopeptide repeat protein [Pseudomonadota bacterium]MBU1595709.1 tetratricopeptide repeat protein [Pseudomonadota bacterium]